MSTTRSFITFLRFNQKLLKRYHSIFHTRLCLFKTLTWKAMGIPSTSVSACLISFAMFISLFTQNSKGLWHESSGFLIFAWRTTFPLNIDAQTARVKESWRSHFSCQYLHVWPRRWSRENGSYQCFTDESSSLQIHHTEGHPLWKASFSCEECLSEGLQLFSCFNLLPALTSPCWCSEGAVLG